MVIKIDTSKIKLPDLSKHEEEIKKIHVAMCQEMAIPKEVLLERTKRGVWHTTAKLPYPSIRTDCIKPLKWAFRHDETCEDCQPKRKSWITELFEALENEGYHQGVIERCKIALLNPKGFEAIIQLMKAPFNYEDVVQALVKVYDEITD